MKLVFVLSTQYLCYIHYDILSMCISIIMFNTSQVHLSTDKLGQSVDECDALLKKHEAFERLIVSQEEKVYPYIIIPHILKKKKRLY